MCPLIIYQRDGKIVVFSKYTYQEIYEPSVVVVDVVVVSTK